VDQLNADTNHGPVYFIFMTFSYCLMFLGLLITASYAVIYYLVFREFRELPRPIFETVFRRMNFFFLLMLVIMGSRTIYYMVMHFTFEQKFTDRPPDNLYLVALYF
jgi:short subunit fatty acids transporter